MDKLGFDLDDGTLQPTEKQANPQVIIKIRIASCFYFKLFFQ